MLDYEHPFLQHIKDAKLAIEMFEGEVNDSLEFPSEAKMDSCHKLLDELFYYAACARENYESICEYIEHAQ